MSSRVQSLISFSKTPTHLLWCHFNAVWGVNWLLRLKGPEGFDSEPVLRDPQCNTLTNLHFFLEECKGAHSSGSQMESVAVQEPWRLVCVFFAVCCLVPWNNMSCHHYSSICLLDVGGNSPPTALSVGFAPCSNKRALGNKVSSTQSSWVPCQSCCSSGVSRDGSLSRARWRTPGVCVELIRKMF